MTPKGKTPSLIGGSLGRPELVTAKGTCKCGRCKEKLGKGTVTFMVPQPGKTFSSPRRFCSGCFRLVLAKTREDLATLEELVPVIPVEPR
jgi:hypothetical protein